MKTLGVLGGMSWESTAVYYRLFNQGVRARLGGQHSAKLLLASVDFAEIVARQHAGDWHGAGQQLAELAAGLQNAGADAILIATNTMHKVAEQVQAAIDVPLLHIGDVVADALLAAGVRRAGLLGTRYTMEQPPTCIASSLTNSVRARSAMFHVKPTSASSNNSPPTARKR